DFVANFDASATKVERDFNPEDPKSFNSSYTTQVFDSLGNTHTVTQYFSKTKENEWKVNIQVDGGSTPVSTQTVSFNTDGTLASSVKPFDIKFPAAGAEEMNIEISLEGSTQFGSSFGVSTNNPNGYASGELVGVRIEDNGEVYATYTNGQSLLQGQVVLADFSNPQGLNKVSGTAWTQSFSSGSPVVGAPGTGILGNLSAGSLEGSNVDLTNELVSLMTAQRNYQANAKTISTSDKLTQALFNAV
ncbi:flagellar hook protein FlgE, partial [Vibrio parahaemolyticus]